MKADGVVVGLTTEAVEGLPTAVEDQVEVVVRPSLQVSPSVDVGAHYDSGGGDADTGSGLEVGGGLAVEHLPTRLSLSAQGRYLVTHHAEAFEEWGAGLTFRVDRGQAGSRADAGADVGRGSERRRCGRSGWTSGSWRGKPVPSASRRAD